MNKINYSRTYESPRVFLSLCNNNHNNMTTEQLQCLPSYEPLKRNGLNDENIRQFYTLPKEQRAAFLNSFKSGVTPTRMDSSTVAVKEQGTQMCTEIWIIEILSLSL
tara:strand:+ start:267 stop:587 length:321 start_codon:yes stop_codon:yes gene_type:complete